MRKASFTLFILISALSLYSQKVHTSLQQIWHNNTWQDTLQDTYTYDSRGLVATKTEQRWNPTTGSWVNNRLETHTYKPDSTEQQHIIQTWDATANAWQNQDMVTYADLLPHGSGSELHQKWVNGSWQNELQVAWISDKKGHLSKSLKQKWDLAKGVWVNDNRADYTCHRNGKIDHWVCQIWDTAIQDWKKNRQDLCNISYDKSWRNLGNSNSIRINNRVRTTGKSFLSYDAQGHKISMACKSWDARSRTWIELWHEDYTNNSDGSVNYYTSLRWNRSGGEPVSKLITKYSYF